MIRSLLFQFWPIFNSMKYPYCQKGIKPDKLELHNLNYSNYSGNFSVRDYILLIQKDSVTHM